MSDGIGVLCSGKRHIDEMSVREIEAFLTYLAVERKLDRKVA